MGAALRAEVERQLISDLAPYGIVGTGLQIDWSNVSQEGHCTHFLGGLLESLDGLVVRNSSGEAIADGWLDFVHGGEGNPLFVFWLFLASVSSSGRHKLKSEALIPEHVWEQFPDRTKWLCTREHVYDATWAKDPKVVAWKRGRAT